MIGDNMKCYICGEEASAICAFCGVALCEEHIKREEKVWIGGTPARGIKRVEDAVWCGECKIHRR